MDELKQSVSRVLMSQKLAQPLAKQVVAARPSELFRLGLSSLRFQSAAVNLRHSEPCDLGYLVISGGGHLNEVLRKLRMTPALAEALEHCER